MPKDIVEPIRWKPTRGSPCLFGPCAQGILYQIRRSLLFSHGRSSGVVKDG